MGVLMRFIAICDSREAVFWVLVVGGVYCRLSVNVSLGILCLIGDIRYGNYFYLNISCH